MTYLSFTLLCSTAFNAFLFSRVFGEDIQGRDCGDEVSRWLTRYLGAEETFRLVYFEPQMKARKPMENKPIFPKFKVKGSFRWSPCCTLIPDFNCIISVFFFYFTHGLLFWLNSIPSYLKEFDASYVEF